jgi:hypothetical protein
VTSWAVPRAHTTTRTIDLVSESYEPKASEGAPGPRWFISAPVGMDLGSLLAGLQRRGGTPYVLSDVAPLGANILQSVQQAVAAADRVLVVLADETASLNSVFEAGMAAALGKPIVIVADPQVRIPTDLAGFLTVRARPDDLDAIDFALDQAEGRIATSTRVAPATGHALGPRADQLLDRASTILTLTDPTAIEQTAVAVLVEALEHSGAVVVDRGGRDRGFDLGVWSDDLDAIAANPLLIELKSFLRVEPVQQALAALSATPNARVALIVYLDPAGAEPEALRSARFPVLAISLAELLERMRTASFAEVVRHLRNRSVHGSHTP